MGDSGEYDGSGDRDHTGTGQGKTLGLPGELEITPELNISFVKRTKSDRIFCATFMPYPGTEIWDHPEQYEVEIITRNLSKYNQVSGVGEEEREFAVIPFGLSYDQLSKNRKRMIEFWRVRIS